MMSREPFGRLGGDGRSRRAPPLRSWRYGGEGAGARTPRRRCSLEGTRTIMQITVRQAATYFGVDEATVRRWISERDLPAHRVNERLHMNAIEVWEWAVAHGVPVSRTLLDEAQRKPEKVPPIGQLLRAGGIHRDLEGPDK